MQPGDRVEMLINDGFAEEGWLGILRDSSHYSSETVLVKWDAGKTFLHQKGHVGLVNQCKPNDPNTLFRRRKSK